MFRGNTCLLNDEPHEGARSTGGMGSKEPFFCNAARSASVCLLDLHARILFQAFAMIIFERQHDAFRFPWCL